MRRSPRSAALLVVAATAVALVATASPASAHAHLETMNPGPGATLKDLPHRVVLTFSEAVRTPAFVQVTGPGGVNVASGEVSIVDEDVTQRLGRPAGAGRYTVSYRITSADGHPVGGTVDFTVLSDAGGGATTPQRGGGQSSSADESGGIGTTQLLLLLGVLVAGLVALAVATRRALRHSVAMVEERRQAQQGKKQGRPRRT